MADETSSTQAPESSSITSGIQRDASSDAAAASSSVMHELHTDNGDPKRLKEDISADEIFAADDHKIIEVPVDEWKKNAIVYVHTPSAADRDHLEQVLQYEEVSDGKGGTKTQWRAIGKDEIRTYFIAMVARNSKGERIFTAKDIKRLKHKSYIPMERIWDAMVKASIITDADVDELAKNSDAASDGSSS